MLTNDPTQQLETLELALEHIQDQALYERAQQAITDLTSILRHTAESLHKEVAARVAIENALKYWDRDNEVVSDFMDEHEAYVAENIAQFSLNEVFEDLEALAPDLDEADRALLTDFFTQPLSFWDMDGNYRQHLVNLLRTLPAHLTESLLLQTEE